MHLPHHPQPVGGIAGQDIGVDGQRRFELRQLERRLEAQEFDAMAQHIQCAALVELVAQAGQQGFIGLCAVVLGQGLPGLGLRRLHPGQHIRREQRPRPVIARRVTLGMEPVVIGEVLADLGLETDFLVQGHRQISDWIGTENKSGPFMAQHLIGRHEAHIQSDTGVGYLNFAR